MLHPYISTYLNHIFPPLSTPSMDTIAFFLIDPKDRRPAPALPDCQLAVESVPSWCPDILQQIDGNQWMIYP